MAPNEKISNIFGGLVLRNIILLPFLVMTGEGSLADWGGDAGQPQSLELLGTFEGKTFYVEKEYKMNWPDANSRCKEENLTLATIESIAQGEFLNRTLSEKYGVDENQSYWLSYVLNDFENSFPTREGQGELNRMQDKPTSTNGPLPFYPPSTYTYYGLFSIITHPYEFKVEAKAGELPHYAMCQFIE